MTRDDQTGAKADQPELFALYDALDRLEELIEDMAELQVRTIDDAEARMLRINGEIDELEKQVTTR